VVQRLTSPTNVNFNIEKNIALMVVTTEHERTVNEETSYWACFQGTNLRRTIIVVGIYCIQTLNGNPLRGYSTYFYEQAGLATTEAFNMTIVGFAVAIVGGFFSVSKYTAAYPSPLELSLLSSGFCSPSSAAGRSTSGASS
jgi:SP family general alpha glucoside:H+ symporter-like MFS transporter